MLSNFLYSVNAVLPIFLLVVLGFILRRSGLLTADFTRCGEVVVFKVALPVMLFLEVAGGDVSEALAQFDMVLFCVIGVTAAFLLTSLLVPLFVRDRRKCGAFVQGMCRSNFAILGVPLAENMFGAAGLSAVAIVMPFAILMFNAYSVILLSVFAPKEQKRSWRRTVREIFFNIITNPLIIAVIVGLPLMIWHPVMPSVLDKSLGYLSALATPLALLCLGANFRVESLRGRFRFTVAAALGKTLLLPAAAVTAAVFLGFSGPSLGCILILFGAPSAVSSYIMAKNMGSDSELAAQILLLSTVLCVFTIFGGIFILKTLNLI